MSVPSYGIQLQLTEQILMDDLEIIGCSSIDYYRIMVKVIVKRSHDSSS